MAVGVFFSGKEEILMEQKFKKGAMKHLGDERIKPHIL